VQGVAQNCRRSWKVEPADPNAAELAARLKISPLTAQALLARGMSGVESAEAFLRPNLKMLAEPALLPGIPVAAQRIAKAIRENEKIVIYGDYDVDGITGSSILWHAIRILGADPTVYIPHRLEEGYGLNAEAINQIIDNGAKLIVSVDCGITAIEEARVAKSRGVEMIVTDHHEWHVDADGTPLLPDCFSIVHPRLKSEREYPNPFLSGAGVAFKLAWAIGQAAGGQERVSQTYREFLIEATALAALGTIADVVPLIGENRALAAFGLGGLRETKLIGLRALIESAALAGKKLDSYHVGFLLAPRLNACGRMGHAALAVEMLTTATEDRAKEIAEYLDEQNRARQELEKKILAQALEQIEANHWADAPHRALVLAGEGWHAGVIGIVAARIVDRFRRPTVMIGLTNGQGQGSARSIAGFHMSKALEGCQKSLLAFGGHEMAAGLRIESGRVEEFRQALDEAAQKVVTDEMLVPQLRLECVAELGQMTEALVTEMQRLGPFGHGNPKPVLCVREVSVAAVPRRVGKTGEHLQLIVKQGQRSIRCIGFHCGELFDRLGPGTKIDLAVEPSLNEFNGRRNVELEIKDIQFNGAD
jgi:single-stranded-DNA-specific exonuclease